MPRGIPNNPRPKAEADKPVESPQESPQEAPPAPEPTPAPVPVPEPTQATSGTTTETTDDNLVPPGMVTHQAAASEAQVHLDRLEDFLAMVFPDEIARTNRQRPEHPVDMAIRLIKALHAHTPPTQVSRCPEPFCNKPTGHMDVHGWIHAG